MDVSKETAARAAVATASAVTSEMACLARVRGRTVWVGRLTMLLAAAMVVVVVLAISDFGGGRGSAALSPADVPALGGGLGEPVLEALVGSQVSSQSWWEIIDKSPRLQMLAIAGGVFALLLLVGCVARCILARRARFVEDRVDTLLAAHNDALSAAHCEAFASDKVALGGQALFMPAPINPRPRSLSPKPRCLSDGKV